MAYIINRYDGSRLVVVDDGILDSSIPVGLVGRNYTGWGEVFNENFVFLLENFKGSSPPVRALEGQAWYDSNNKVLKAFDGEQWNSIGNAAVTDTEPNPTQGGLWLKSTTDQLYVSVDNEWKLVGPEGIEGYGTTRVKSEILIDTQNISRPVAITYINGQPISIFSAETFSIPQNSVPGFAIIDRGLTFRSDAVISGNLKGNADTASVFKTPRNINSVAFDGSQNIVVKASTTNPLLKGDYIVGSDWDGSLTDRWSVDATPENRIGKVVARDANGEFSAERIISNLTGNVAGNITALSGVSQFNELTAAKVTAPDLVGNASTATRLRIARTINTVPFDGTINITLPVPAETLVGNTLAPNILASSLTSLGKLSSLEIEDTGLSISNTGSNLKILINQFTPTIRSEITNAIRLELQTGSSQSSTSDITYISASSASQIGINSPSLVPDWNKSVPDGQKINLGLPNSRWNTVYSNSFDGTNLKIASVSAAENLIDFNNGIRVAGSITGNLFGNVSGNLTGTVTGNLVGASSLNVLKSGDIMTGDLSWQQPDRGVVWSAFTDGASIKFVSNADSDNETRLEFNTRDNGNEYFLFSHTYAAGNTINLMRLDPNDNFGNVKMSVYGNVVASGSVTANSFSGSGANITGINAANLSTGRVPNQRLSGGYDISISGNANTVTAITGSQVTTALGYVPVRNSGDTITGDLSIVKPNAWLVLDSPSVGPNGTDQAAGISIGESGYKGSASLHLTYTGDGYGHIGMGPVDTSTSIPQFRAMRLYYLNNDVDFYGTITVPTVNATLLNGNGGGISNLNAGNLSSGSVPVGRLSGTYNINISGNAATASTATTATNISGGVVNATTGSFSGILNVSASINGGIRFPNDAFGGGSDTARITLETKGGEATTLTFRVTNDADDTIGFFAPSDNGLTMNNHIVLHAANYTNFLPTKTGVGASGTWPINVTGNAATVSSISNSQIIAALGYTPAPNPLSGGGAGQFTSLLIDNVGNAELRFNSRGDSNQDLVISVQGEDFVIYEPDDGNREWFRINDTNISGGSRSAFVYGQKMYDHNNITFTYGNTQFSTSGFTNQVGSWNDSRNHFDVFPPSGYSMSSLLAFIPSIAVIHYAGGVNGDDSMRCTWSQFGDRIRVYVQNTEQRSTPAANWLAIWRR